MSKKVLLSVAVAAFALAATPALAAPGAMPPQVASVVASVVARGDIAPAAETLPADFGMPRAGDAESHVAKAGVWSSIKKAAGKVAGAAKKVAGAVKKAAVATGKFAAKHVPPVTGVINGYKAAKYFLTKRR